MLNTIRLWKLGYLDTDNLNNSIFPTKENINKLKSLLNDNSNGGIIDIVWGPDISCEIISNTSELVTDKIIIPVCTDADGYVLYRIEGLDK